MAEELKNTELANTASGVTNQGLVGNISNTLEKIRRFSNEPAVQRSIPVMITLFVIFLGLIFFISFKEPSRTTLFSALPEHEKSRIVDVLRNNGIDVSIDQTTGEVLVPKPDYYEAKMKLPQKDFLVQSLRVMIFLKISQWEQMFSGIHENEANSGDRIGRSINEISHNWCRVHLAIPENLYLSGYFTNSWYL